MKHPMYNDYDKICAVQYSTVMECVKYVKCQSICHFVDRTMSTQSPLCGVNNLPSKNIIVKYDINIVSKA